MLSGLKGRLNAVARTTGAQPQKPAAPQSADCMVLRADYPLDESAMRA